MPQQTALQRNLQKKLNNSAKTLVIGVGSELRRDDAAGILAVRALSQFQTKNFTLLEGGTAPENLTGKIKELKPDLLIFIDAAQMGLSPGRLELIEPEKIGGISFSTHSLPLSVLINFIRADLPCEILVLGIQPKDTGFGSSLSKEVKAALAQIPQMFRG